MTDGDFSLPTGAPPVYPSGNLIPDKPIKNRFYFIGFLQYYQVTLETLKSIIVDEREKTMKEKHIVIVVEEAQESGVLVDSIDNMLRIQVGAQDISKVHIVKNDKQYLIDALSYEDAKKNLDVMRESQKDQRTISEFEDARALRDKVGDEGMMARHANYLRNVGVVSGIFEVMCKAYDLGFRRGYRKAGKKKGAR